MEAATSSAERPANSSAISDGAASAAASSIALARSLEQEPVQDGHASSSDFWNSCSAHTLHTM